MSGAGEDLDLVARGWVAEDQILRAAWRLTRSLDLDPAHAQRIQRATCVLDDGTAVLAAIAELLEAIRKEPT